jgi:hypothetical protein
MKTSTVILLIGGVVVVWYLYNNSSAVRATYIQPTTSQLLATNAGGLAQGISSIVGSLFGGSTSASGVDSYLTDADLSYADPSASDEFFNIA